MRTDKQERRRERAKRSADGAEDAPSGERHKGEDSAEAAVFRHVEAGCVCVCGCVQFGQHSALATTSLLHHHHHPPHQVD